MKKLTLLLATVLLSVAAYAQRVSIADFCYKDMSMNTIETFSDSEIISHLAVKGYVVTNRETYYAEGAGGFTTRFVEITLYQRSTNTTVVIDQGPDTITFPSSSHASAFITEAIQMGYIAWDNGYYCIVHATYAFGVESLTLSGRIVEFCVSVP